MLSDLNIIRQPVLNKHIFNGQWNHWGQPVIPLYSTLSLNISANLVLDLNLFYSCICWRCIVFISSVLKVDIADDIWWNQNPVSFSHPLYKLKVLKIRLLYLRILYLFLNYYYSSSSATKHESKMSWRL